MNGDGEERPVSRAGVVDAGRWEGPHLETALPLATGLTESSKQSVG